METIDMQKLERAIVYLERIADGKNPVNNLPAEEDSVLNNPNVIRCMFFVKDVLEQVKQNNGHIGKKKSKSERMEFPTEMVKNFSYKEDLPITKFVAQLNEGIDDYIYKKINVKQITDWLKLNDFLQEEHNSELNKKVTVATSKGAQLGIRSEIRISSNRMRYMGVIYGKQAQEYICHNIEKLVNGEVAE